MGDAIPLWHDDREPPPEPGWYLVIALLPGGGYVAQRDFFRRPSRLFPGTWDRGWTYAPDPLPGSVVAWAEEP